MKINHLKELKHTQLKSERTGELYSRSAVVSGLLSSDQLFVHHDIIEPGGKSSAPHKHSIIEELVFVLRGDATVVENDVEYEAYEGSLVIFEPATPGLHFVVNKTGQNIETVTFSVLNTFDRVVSAKIDVEIQFPKYTFDLNLREVPDDVNQWNNFIDDLKFELEAENHSEKKLILLEYIGVAKRILKNLDEATVYLQKAVTLSYSHPNPSRLIQNFLRLAHVYQWANEFEKAQLLFDQAKNLMQEKTVSDLLRASFHQHYGKLCFDQKYFDLAKIEFTQALEIRKSISAPQDQIDSSQMALNEVNNRITS